MSAVLLQGSVSCAMLQGGVSCLHYCCRLVCHSCIVVTGWCVMLQGSVSCLQCCYRGMCHVAGWCVMLQGSVSCLQCCYRGKCHVAGWCVMSASLLLQGGPGGSEARPPGATTPLAHHGTAVRLSHHHQPWPVRPASDAAWH